MVNTTMKKTTSVLFRDTSKVPEDIAEAVDYYVEECGLFIVPCDIMNSKRPMAKWRLGTKMMRPAELKKLARRGGGIGFPIPRGLVVVDLDVNDYVNGVDSFLDIVFSHQLSDSPLNTLTVVTPSGGSHLYYRGDLSVTNAGQVGPGIDLRGGGTGLVVLPPSYGKGFNGRYLFDQTVSQYERRIPPWLAKDILDSRKNLDAHVDIDLHELPELSHETTKAGRRYLKKTCAAIAQAYPGTRNNTLNRCVYAISRAISGGDIAYEDAMVAIEDAAQKSGLKNSEISATINSALTAGVKVPLKLKEIPTLKKEPENEAKPSNQ